MRLGDRARWLPYLTHAERDELAREMTNADECRVLYERHKARVGEILAIAKRRAAAASIVKEAAE